MTTIKNEKRLQSDQIIVYSSESAVRNPRQFIKMVWNDLNESYQLALRLTIRDLSAQYRQTFLGYLWAILPPLLTSIIFIILNRANIIVIKDISIPYPVFVITGTIFWQLFVDALNTPLNIMATNRAMISKISFPHEALIISSVMQVLFSFVIKLVLLIIFLLIYKVSIMWTAILLFVPIFGLFLIGTVLGVILIPVGILYQDIQKSLIFCTSALMFMTPVLYPAPKFGGAYLSHIISYNPLSVYFNLTRGMLYSRNLDQLWISFTILIPVLIIFIFGWLIYRIALPILVERMDA